MNALWIIDLSESGNVVQTFFDSYWEAFLENQKDPKYPLAKRNPWFHVSSPQDLGLCADGNEPPQVLGQKILDAVRKADNLINATNGKIRYPFTPAVNRITVAVMGSLESLATQRFFLPLTTSLKADTMNPARHWNPTPNVYFYGMLFRREEVAAGTHLSAAEKAFLNQLHNIQSVWSTFEHVLFFEKPYEQKEDAVKEMALASLHLSYEESHAERVLRSYDDRDPIPVFLNAGASGVFFEREVQNDREAFLLGHTLLEPFVNSSDPVFYDQDAAIARAQEIPVFHNNELDERRIYHHLSQKMPELDTTQFDIPMPVKPGSPRVAEVWPRYYGGKDGYIANLKAKLVNKVKLELAVFEQKCLKRISDNQLQWIKRQSAAVEDGIFAVFDDQNPDSHCSMRQAIEVARQAEELAQRKIKGKAEDISLVGEDGLPLRPVVIPDRYLKAIRTAQLGNENVNPNDVLNELDKKLRRHPVFMFSMFTRALLLSIILGLFFIFSQPIVAAVLFVLPFVAYFLVYRHYMNVLKSLQDRYVGLSLLQLNEKLLRSYKEAIHKSQTDIRDYCKWNWKDRLEMLRRNLGVLVPKTFHFKAFEDFHPLITDNLRIETEDKVRRVGRTEGDVQEAAAMISGEFDNLPLLRAVPGFNVNLRWMATPKSVLDLTEEEKMRLIHDLMKESAYVPQQMEENLDPAKMIIKSAGSAVLMLDVSGSMSGQPHEDLKNAVKTLKEKFHDQIRWVAFADRAVLDHDTGDDLDKAEAWCGGGTEYVPAFELLLTAKEKNLIDLGKLIIISDGCPFDTERAKKKILELGCVVDVIYIGAGNQDYLRELAESTGGTLQQVQDVKDAQIETVVEEGIKTGFKLADEGNFLFGTLLKKSAVKPTMKALLKYCKGLMMTSRVCIESMIADHGNPAGLNNWLANRPHMCALNPGIMGQLPLDIHIKSSGIDQERMCQTLQQAAYQFTNEHKCRYELVIPIDKTGDREYKPEFPDMLVTQLHIMPLSGINDLAWSFDPDNDRQLEGEHSFFMLYRSYFGAQYNFVNICGTIITVEA